VPLIPPNRITAFPLKDDLAWYNPDVIFQPFDDIFGRGVISSGDLSVIANGPADSQIRVNPGRAYVPYQSGGKRLFQTSVIVHSDDPEFQHAVGAYTGTPRVDRIVAKILDATLNPPDSLKGGVFDVLAGTPTAGANLTNLSGAASVPATALLLGNVLVSGSTIPSGNIDSTFGTVRARARIGGGNSPAKPIQVNGAAMTDRSALNLIAGANMTISGADNAGADSQDVTFAATVPTPAVVKLFDYLVAGAAKNTIDTYADAGNVTLPGSYAGLLIHGRVQSNTAAVDTGLLMNFNNDSTGNYDNDVYDFSVAAPGPGADPYNITQTQTQFFCMRVNGANASAGWGSFVIQIPNYASTTGRHNYILDGVDSGASTLRRWVGTGVWHGAGSAINRIQWSLGAGAFAVGSRITVWGIL